MTRNQHLKKINIHLLTTIYQLAIRG